MEKINVIYLSDVRERLKELVFILYEKGYFSFLESSFDYVDRIIDFIEWDIENFPHKETPDALIRFGSKYVFYKANENTTWYIFFETKDNRFIVTYITNNHTEDAQFL